MAASSSSSAGPTGRRAPRRSPISFPLERLAAVDGVEQAALAAWSASTDAPAATATVSTGTLRDGARALVTADDGTILVSMLDVGAGRVILVGTDLATDTYRGWDGAPRLWTRLLPSNAALEGFFGAPSRATSPPP